MADELHEEIKRAADKIPGCRYVSLVGYDGIPVAQHIIDVDYDVNAYDAEISSIMLATQEVKDNLELSDERELIWLTKESFFIIHPVGADYFVYACLKAAGSNPGAARIALNKTREIVHKLIYHEA
ncbi:roadblock/LC7 domain-containing protein [candidate division WOR-3 bacterium]|nr:roadblock/LC7 domain-containing protein [candidate division WOR-3 bacterium]